MRDKDTPLPLIQKWSRLLPDCYKHLDVCHAAKGHGDIQWADYCELPIAAAQGLLVERGFSLQMASMQAAELTACWIWRRNKIVYAFDEDLTKALLEQAEGTNDTDVLPVDLLLHLPYPCVYLKAPVLDGYDGFFVWLESDQRYAAPELRFQFVTHNKKETEPHILHLVPGRSIQSCFRHTLAHMDFPPELSGTSAVRTALEYSRKTILSALQLVLYLVSQQADIQDRTETKEITNVNKNVKRDKPIVENREIKDRVNEIISKDVGVRIGAALRAGYKNHSSNTGATGIGGSKRPHARRGHWHHYWTGKSDNKTLILKWVAPTFIHPDISHSKDVVVFPVRDRKDRSRGFER